MSKINLDTLPKMQSAIKDVVKFRGASSSTNYNTLQEDLFFDISNLFNIVSEYENRLNETSTLQAIDNIYTQMRLKELEMENERLRTELDNFLYSEDKKYYIDVFNAITVENLTAPCINYMFNQINLNSYSSKSKLYLYDEGADLITIPSSLKYEITPTADDIHIIDNDFTKAFNGNINEHFVRKIISDDTLEKKMEIVIELPDNIISSRNINAIEIVPYPYAATDIVSIQYQLNGAWTEIPGFRSHRQYQSETILNQYGDLEDVGHIRNAECIKLCFQKTAMSRIKIVMRQRTYTVENNKYIFYMGIKNFAVNCESVSDSYCEFYSDIIFTEDEPKLITKVTPHFNNDIILSDQTDEKKTLMSYELYEVDEDGAKEYLKNSFPIVAYNKRYMLVTRMYYDRTNDINPSLARLELEYSLTNGVPNTNCTCTISDINLGLSDIIIPYNNEADISILNATAKVTNTCTVDNHGTNTLPPVFKYKIKSTNADVSIENNKLITKSAGMTIITVEVHYNGKRIQKDFTVVSTKETSPSFTLNYSASIGGSLIGQTLQVVKWKGDGTPVEAVADVGAQFIGWSDGVKTIRRTDLSVRDNIDVTALFQTQKHIVTWMAYTQAGVMEAVKTQEVPHGYAATPPILNDIPGYEFAGWDKSYASITEPIIITAQYTKVYTVTFKDYDGRVISVQNIKAGEDAIAPNNPIRTGYTFLRWHGDFTNITMDTEITAEYQVNYYTVTFSDHDGTTLKTESVAFKQAATPPTPPDRVGYNHIGWDKAYTSIIRDVDIVAVYRLKKYVVKFLDDNGTVLTVQQVEHGNGAIAPVPPTKPGLTFDRWDKEFSNVTEDLEVRAIYS